MVLSLVDICRASLRNAVESGPVPYLHFFVSPKLRQSVLDMVMMHGTVNTENCVKNLGSSNFLRGLWSLDTQEGVVNDSWYLDQLTESMATVLENGETIGSRIKNLKLNLYFIAEDLGNNVEYHDAVNFNSVVRLIAQCQNLASLDLRFVGLRECGSLYLTPTSGGLLNETGALRPCLPILENLSEFSLNGNGKLLPVFAKSHPIIKFEKLTSLNLEWCFMSGVAWRQLLQCIQGTLVELRTDKIQFVLGEDDAAQVMLPFPLPHLKTLKMERPQLEYSQEFVKNLSQCEKLDYALLELDAPITNAQLDGLASITALRVNLCFCFDPRGEDLNRVVRLAELFSGRVESLILASDLRIRAWAPENTAALKRIIDLCSNLTALELHLACRVEGESKRQLEEAKRHLRSLFSNQERASKLRTLELAGDFDYGVLKSLFENCLWLDSLIIDDCPQLSDDHLIEWASRGARPRVLSIQACKNISDEGLVPVLISSGSQLFVFSFSHFGDGKIITNRTWRALIDHCPFVKPAFAYVPDELWELWRSERFRLC